MSVVGIIGAGRLGTPEAGGRAGDLSVGRRCRCEVRGAVAVRDAGFAVIDLGGLRAGGAMQQIGGPLADVNLIRLTEGT
jgi:hypothetical protein